MRTTLDIDDDILAVAKEISRKQGISAGQAISRLLRDALTGKAREAAESTAKVGGFRPFPARGTLISNELIDNLRDSEGL